jgi:regulator of nucleoside diphosphate kinase
MATESQRRRKPAITLTRTDHDRLSRLAESAPAHNADIAEQLFQELDRARVVADERIAASVVRMGSRIRFSSDAGADRTVTIVFPGEADIAAGKISILTPIGAALIGLSSGQSIEWTARDGRTHRLRVECVDETAMRTEARDAARAPS